MKMNEQIIGIDLGTSFSEMSYIKGSGAVEIIPNMDGDLKTPSIVSRASGYELFGSINIG